MRSAGKFNLEIILNITNSPVLYLYSLGNACNKDQTSPKITFHWNNLLINNRDICSEYHGVTRLSSCFSSGCPYTLSCFDFGLLVSFRGSRPAETFSPSTSRGIHNITTGGTQLLDSIRMSRSLRLVGRSLMATDIHTNLLLERVNAEPVEGFECQAEWSKDASRPSQDKENRDELAAKESEVSTSTSPFVEP